MQPLEYSIAVLGKIHFPPIPTLLLPAMLRICPCYCSYSCPCYCSYICPCYCSYSCPATVPTDVPATVPTDVASCNADYGCQDHIFQVLSLLGIQANSDMNHLPSAKDRKVARVKENLTEDGFRRVKPLFWKGVKGWIKVLLPAWNLPDDKVLKKLLSLPSGPFDDKDGADAEGTVHRTIKDEASKSPRKKAGCDKPQREKQKTSNTTFDWSKPLLKWSKPQLQTYLAEHNLRTSGNKPELIE
eukprot:Em0009g909a